MLDASPAASAAGSKEERASPAVELPSRASDERRMLTRSLTGARWSADGRARDGEMGAKPWIAGVQRSRIRAAVMEDDDFMVFLFKLL